MKLTSIIIVIGLTFSCAVSLAASPAPELTKEESATFRFYLRHVFFQQTSSFCSARFPAQANEYNKLLTAWAESNKPKLDEAESLMLKHAAKGGHIDVSGLADLEKAHTKVWMVTKLGISENRDIRADDCTKMMRNLSKVD